MLWFKIATMLLLQFWRLTIYMNVTSGGCAYCLSCDLLPKPASWYWSLHYPQSVTSYGRLHLGTELSEFRAT